MPGLLVLDFDETIISPHTFRLIEWVLRSELAEKAKKKPTEITEDELKAAAAEFIQKGLADGTLKINNKEMLRNLIKASLDTGQKVAVCSFTKFPLAVKAALASFLPPADVAKILVETALPDGDEQKAFGKNNHIIEVLKKAKLELTTRRIDRIVFVDDDTNNIQKFKTLEEALKGQGITCKGILVPSPAADNPEYITQAINLMGVAEYIEKRGIASDAIEYMKSKLGANVAVDAKSWLFRFDDFSISFANKGSKEELQSLEKMIRDLLPTEKQAGVVARESSRATEAEMSAGKSWTLNINAETLAALAELSKKDLSSSSAPKLGTN